MKKIKRIDLCKCTPFLDIIREHLHSYSNWGADYSVTDLISSPQIVQLRKRYTKEIEQNRIRQFNKEPVKVISQLLPSIRGTAIHNLFEYYITRILNRQDNSDYYVERRVWDRIEDRKISGKFDVYYQRIIIDYKTTSVWKVILADIDDWIGQQNIYAYFLREAGLKVAHLRIFAWYMDWDKYRAMRESDYPQSEIEYLEIPLWDKKQQLDYLVSRIKLHKQNEQRPDNELDPCTPQEMWEKQSKWKVFRTVPNPSKKALRVFNSEQEAKIWIDKHKKKNQKYEIRFVPGERTRCKYYCSVNVFCHQYKKYREMLCEKNKKEKI